MEGSSQQNQINEGYASSISTDYSEEASSESDYSESDDAESIDAEDAAKFDKGWDGKENGKYVGPFACLNNYKPKYEHKKLFVQPANSSDDESEDETQQSTKSESGGKTTLNSFLSSKPTGDIWKQSRRPQELILKTRANFSLDGKYYLFQVLSGLLTGLHLASDHGCYSPYVRCNSRIVVTLLCQIASRSCKCEGSKIGKICHRCASSIVPYMSDDCFETLVPPIEQPQDKYKYLGPTNFACVSRKMNEAAHYLAKAKKDALSNKKELLVDYENGKLVDYEVDMKPNEFPEKLVCFLLNDAYDSIYYNLDARGRLVG
ncbi:hypothetical protein MKW98_008091 [Papaver atlanticum]|uniref:Uncharacterized protein n=1 Tax=Papaver atlanticum TaxID=357466 RepID=A0AAD4XAR8_9MAGN|nr:hypothetical protein MKW98_008091 [Papaver atlanticum]